MASDRLALGLYGTLWHMALPWVRARLAQRAARDPAYRAHQHERFAKDLPAGPFDLWVHAVSVGETRAAEPLLTQWLRERPGTRVLITHMTPTGRSTSEQLFGERITRCYLPYDHPRLARQFIARTQPRLGLIFETELWPNVIAAAHRAQIPLWLVNARLSARSARGYARWRSLTRATLVRLQGVLAQTEVEAERFRALGATSVVVTGNIKFDCEVPTAQLERAGALRARLAPGMHWVAGSTREGDEDKLLTALRTHPLRQLARAIIVPRHPQRFDEVYGRASALGFRVARRSTVSAGEDYEVLIGDSMGEMFAYYSLARVAFIGGSFETGSQNLIEPCAVGTPIVLGPSVYNFQAAAEAALAMGAGVQVATPAQALEAIQALIVSDSQHALRSAAATQFCNANRGALARTLGAIATHNDP